MCIDQAAMTFDAWWDDAMLTRKRVAWLHPFDWADFDEGIVAGRAGSFDAAICDGLEGRRLGSRGVSFYIIELVPALARHEYVGPVSGVKRHQSCHH